MEPGQTRSGRGWAVSKGGAENWGALGHRGLQLGGPQGSGRVSAHSLKHALSACGHIPATRVCTRGPGRVVGRAHAWESPVCVCTGSTVGTRVAQLGSNKRCPGRATATTRAVCPTHTRTDTRTPTAGLADGAPACSAEPRLWTCPAPRWPRPRALSWAPQPRRGLRPVTDRPPTARSGPLCSAMSSLPQSCGHCLPTAPGGSPRPACPWPTVAPEPATAPAQKTLSPRSPPDCVRPPSTQGRGPGEAPPLPTTSASLCPCVPRAGALQRATILWFALTSSSAPRWKPTGASWRHCAPGAPTAPHRRAQLAQGAPPPAVRRSSPSASSLPRYTPAGPASKAPSPPPVISAAAPRLRLPARESPGPGLGRSRPRPAARCDFHILLAACAHLTAAA